MMKPIFYLLFSSLLFVSCQLVEFSPFDADVDDHDLNSSYITELKASSIHNDTFKFAVISDTHSYYDEFAGAIASINRQENLHFVVCCGDITESGLSWEYKKYHELSKRLKYPIITCVGNHDYLSNGYKIYQRMFGHSNFVLFHEQYKFVFFDDVVWEKNNSAPNFEWLQAVLSESDDPTVLIAHIPPWTDQLEGNNALTYNKIVAESNVMLCLYGHEHTFSERIYESKPSVVSRTVLKRTYNIVSLFGNQYTIKRISF